ncbi:MAG: DUF2779 domain-containing protein, partial [Malacoplasma sp.]|nr:DUF2779 domain-containing protein [Malacoplasma sp.]
MKISKYLGKYNFIDYYTKPKGLWFFSIQEIESKLESDILFYKKKNKLEFSNLDELVDEDDEENFEEGSEIDSYEFYKEYKESNPIDSRENNIYITQGNIIDKESRKHIISLNSEITNHYDLEKKYKNKTNEQQAKKTEELIKKNKSIIIFQPVFIYQNLITKPDALIKKGSEIKIVETKGTTTAKFVHYLDLFFQMNVIENQSYLKNLDFTYDYELCLIEYNFLNKNLVSLQTTPYINLSKAVSFPDLSKKGITSIDDVTKIKNEIKKGKPYSENLEPLKIKDLMYSNFNAIETNIECSTNGQSSKKYRNSYEIIKKINEEFRKVITELEKHKRKLNSESVPIFEPSINDKSPIKNCDYFPLERKLYSLMGYNLYNFSGNVADQNKEKIEYVKKNDDIQNFLKQPKKNPTFYLDLFKAKEKILINELVSESKIKQLHSNKVYFDFETINSPIRVIDNSLPFMQIVTQCSIIKATKKDKPENLKCENLIIDPKKITIKWFENIIDKLYFGPNPELVDNTWKIKKQHNTSYVVYNKSFECSRLKEMAKFISKPLYSFKVNEIIKNIYDLADFFKLSSSSDYGYILFFKELFGFYSIKKVLPLVGKYNKKIYQTAKCLNYEDLEISNGQICQEETTKRFFDLLSNEEWKKLENEMKIYCENDVRSMLAIELFI